MLVVLDANVFVSAAIQRGASYRIVQVWLTGTASFEVVMCPALLAEIRDVLTTRPRLRKWISLETASLFVGGCPEVRGTSVAARWCSGGLFLILAGGCDGAGGVSVEGGAQCWEVEVAVDPSELLGGLAHPGGAPAQRHLSVTPSLDVGAVVTADLDHRLDRVRGPQGACQRRWNPETAHGEGLGQAFA